jgi:hypothetical protein
MIKCMVGVSMTGLPYITSPYVWSVCFPPEGVTMRRNVVASGEDESACHDTWSNVTACKRKQIALASRVQLRV